MWFLITIVKEIITGKSQCKTEKFIVHSCRNKRVICLNLFNSWAIVIPATRIAQQIKKHTHTHTLASRKKENEARETKNGMWSMHMAIVMIPPLIWLRNVQWVARFWRLFLSLCLSMPPAHPLFLSPLPSFHLLSFCVFMLLVHVVDEQKIKTVPRITRVTGKKIYFLQYDKPTHNVGTRKKQ